MEKINYLLVSDIVLGSGEEIVKLILDSLVFLELGCKQYISIYFTIYVFTIAQSNQSW